MVRDAGFARENREHREMVQRIDRVLPALRAMRTENPDGWCPCEQEQGRRRCLVGNTVAELVPGHPRLTP